jgi:hypothetical protein
MINAYERNFKTSKHIQIMLEFTELVEKIPDWKKYYTVDELDRTSVKLADDYPGKISLIKLGKSAQGKTINCLKLGNGKFNALIHGFPNCEEPYGGNLLVYLAEALAQNDKVRENLDFTWFLIPCSDPDGAELNEGFHNGENTPLNFTLNYYRTPNSITPESCFPIHFGPLNLDNPVSETKALMKIMDKNELHFVSSLHMMKWGGVTFEVPHACPELYAPLWESAKKFSIFPRKRPGTTIATGVMKADYLTPARGYIRHWAAGNKNIEPIQGCYIYEYGQMLNPNLFMMIPECCIWFDPRMWDDTPTNWALGDSLRYAHERATETDRFLCDVWGRSLPHLKENTPFKLMMEEELDSIINKYTNVSNPPFVFDAKVHSRKATTAEKIGIEGREDLYVMFPLGGILRTLDAEIEKGGNSRLDEIRREVYEKILEYDRHLHKTYKVTSHPIKNLVGMGINSILHSALYAKNRQF